MFIGRTDAEAEIPILWPPHAKSGLIGKTLMLGGTGGRRRRETEDEMDCITELMDMRLCELQELVIDREAWLLRLMGLQRVGHD